MRVIADRIRRLVADESGFTMVTVMGVLLVATLFSVAAIAAADRDIPQSRADIDRKQAYAAAEAGVNDYLARLNQNSNYWTNCTNVQAPAPVNQRFTRTSPTQADPRKWRAVPGSTEAEYTIELIPAPGKASCDTADPVGSMIDPNTGGFTIRATGRSSPKGQGASPVYRSITTRFRRRGFLDFLYFTDLETSDPEFFAGTSNYTTMLTECKKYKRNGRASPPCSEITFIGGDQVNGPLHTNDRLLISGHPEFGRDKKDKIEVSAKDGVGPPNGPAWEPNGSGNPVPWRGTFVPGAPRLDLPPSNAELANVAGNVFTGDTELEFNGSTVTVRNKALNPTATNYESTWNLASDPNFNGVIYVKNGTCVLGGTMRDPYPDPDGSGPLTKDLGCGNVWVSGQYDRSITIAAENHIIIRADRDPGSGPGGKGLRRGGSAMMGLIANQFIRVYHPIVGGSPCNSGDANASGTVSNVQIDAAILSLNHSFAVDNYNCGSKLGTLTVNGAIAQKHRGPVGTFGGSGTGYLKNYSYDDRLLYRSPPYFLDPVQSAWRTVKHTEEAPAAK